MSHSRKERKPLSSSPTLPFYPATSRQSELRPAPASTTDSQGGDRSKGGGVVLCHSYIHPEAIVSRTHQEMLMDEFTCT